MHGFHSLSLASAVTIAVLSFTPCNAAAAPHVSVARHRRAINPPSTTVPAYKLTENFVGKKFYDGFDFFNRTDPTGGFVNYVSKDVAFAKNLTHADAGSFVFRADTTNVLPQGTKRDSVRIESKRKYQTHLQVLDVAHMPEGKSTWPAYWMVGADWPNKGELDIVEGANDLGPNLMSLHTGPNCSMPAANQWLSSHKGTIKAVDCYAFANPSNTGCGVWGDSKRDFGPAFNAAGGGWFVTERRPQYIKIWFWSHSDPNVPASVKSGAKSIDPSKWSKPTASFQSSTCDLDTHFGPHQIVMNLDICGGWAGHTFGAEGIPACEAFAASTPSAYAKAFWNIRSLRIYE